MKKVYLYALLASFWTCSKFGRGPEKSDSSIDTYKIKIDSVLNAAKFNEWCEFHLREEEGELNYMDVQHFHQLIGSGRQNDYADIHEKTDILGRYFLDLTNKDSTKKIYNLCVYDFSDDLENHLICRIQMGPEYNKSYLLSQKTYSHGNYTCSESWYENKFTGFGRLGKQHYYFGHCGTGSGFCSEDRIILNSNGEEFTNMHIPYSLWSCCEFMLVSYSSKWKMVNDSILVVHYYFQDGICPDPNIPCDFEEMKRTKHDKIFRFTFRKDSILCSDTASLNKLGLGLYW